MRPAAEPKSWVSDQPVEALRADALVWPDRGAGLYTHNVEHFCRKDATPAEAEEPDVEPTLGTPPHWMIMIAGSAVAALMGALLGGMMHI